MSRRSPQGRPAASGQNAHQHRLGTKAGDHLLGGSVDHRSGERPPCVFRRWAVLKARREVARGGGRTADLLIFRHVRWTTRCGPVSTGARTANAEHTSRRQDRTQVREARRKLSGRRLTATRTATGADEAGHAATAMHDRPRSETRTDANGRAAQNLQARGPCQRPSWLLRPGPAVRSAYAGWLGAVPCPLKISHKAACRALSSGSRYWGR